MKEHPESPPKKNVSKKATFLLKSLPSEVEMRHFSVWRPIWSGIPMEKKNAPGSTPSTRSATETRGIIKSDDDWKGGLNSFEWTAHAPNIPTAADSGIIKPQRLAGQHRINAPLTTIRWSWPSRRVIAILLVVRVKAASWVGFCADWKWKSNGCRSKKNLILRSSLRMLKCSWWVVVWHFQGPRHWINLR